MQEQDELLLYYQQELAFIRRLGEQFAEAHPKIAGRLRLGPKTVEDPHVARLMEAFALGNARIRHKIEDELPEITDALLSALNPEALAPIPSMSVIQFQTNPSKLSTARTIPTDTEIESEVINGVNCKFKTRYPAQLLPVLVERAVIAGKPVTAPIIPEFSDALAVLRLTLTPEQNTFSFANLGVNFLRFFINAPAQYAYILHELLFNRVVGVALAQNPMDPHPVPLPKNSLQMVGFKEEEGMLPYNKRVFMGYRFLTEYFLFPEKFLFFDLIGLEKPLAEKFRQNGGPLEIYFYLNQLPQGLDKNLHPKFFALSCAPVVNLFEKRAEPFILNHTKSEYHIVPDSSRLPEATEIYHVKKVTAFSDNGEQTEYLPFYGLKHGADPLYYHVSRKPAWFAEQYPVVGTEIFLSFTDFQEQSRQQDGWTVNVELMCTNRDLPSQLPFGEGQPYFKFVNNKLDTVKQMISMTPITPSYRPFLKKGAKWRMVSQLQLNYLSLTNDEQGIEALRELIRCYNYSQTNDFENLLDGLLEIGSRQVMHRRAEPRGNPFWHGIEIILTVDERKFAGNSLFLFACVLDYFFSLYVSINSFTQLRIKNRHSELYCFPARAGEKILL